MTNEKSHVDRTVKNVQDYIEVQAGRKLSSLDGAPQGLVSLLPAGPQKARPKRFQQASIGLSRSQQRRDDAAARRSKYSEKLIHLHADIPKHGTGIGKMKLLFGTVGERIHHQRSLVGPPAIDSRLADIGLSSNGLNRQIGKAGMLQQLERASQNGASRLLAAGPAGQTGSAVGPIVRTACLPLAGVYLPHALTIAYI